ncbi:flagellar biosynthetic protein FliR [Acuticoccus sediminis]|uniref:flagellar biosynthetic protein FliR n=1 Tax=Acuticoccus sediminis TaxID=2184697 RepID=UPI001CFDD649|nr:flagellar biosynthetic protein FliR [Acuticoccus sediminis]
MTEPGPDALVLAVAVVFARVGGVFMIAPGLSSMRAPVQVKLFVALGIALAVAPLVLDRAVEAVGQATPGDLVAVLVTETIIGFLIGLLSRCLMMALQTISVGIANAIGLGGVPGLTLEAGEQGQAAATLFMATATVIIFVADLHYEILRALVGSYRVLAPGAVLDVRQALVSVTDQLAAAFFVALRLAAPFLIYSVVVNFAIGITNKLTPSIPVFFVSLPFVTAGGLIMMALAIREVMVAFSDAFRQLTGAL